LAAKERAINLTLNDLESFW